MRERYETTMRRVMVTEREAARRSRLVGGRLVLPDGTEHELPVDPGLPPPGKAEAVRLVLWRRERGAS